MRLKLTAREKEILEILKKEPLISQDELAKRLGIARSSAAVHVSNLMKKGAILGRGYVFNERVSAVVLGQSAVELNVTAAPPGGPDNASRISLEPGGFACKVAASLARFGLGVKVLTVLGIDDEGNRIIDKLLKDEVDTSNLYRTSQHSTPKLVRITGREKLIEYYDRIGWEVFEGLLDIWGQLLVECEWLLVEHHLVEPVVRRLSHRDPSQWPYLGTAFLAGNNGSLSESLGDCHLVVLGVSGNNMEEWVEKGLRIVERGLPNLVVTDGTSKILVASQRGLTEVPLAPNQGFEVVRGLEPFLAGTVYGLTQGYHYRQAVRMGSRVASLAGAGRF